MIERATRIRPATLQDEAAANNLVLAALPDNTHTYARNIRYPNECVSLVAEAENKSIVGFVSLLLEAPQHGQEWRKYALYIGAMAVHAPLKRMGIGSGLLHLLTVHARARAPQHQYFYLHVLETNEEAVSFYTKSGFERIMALPPNKKCQIALLMRKYIGDFDVAVALEAFKQSQT